jgi:hypothetical protein
MNPPTKLAITGVGRGAEPRGDVLALHALAASLMMSADLARAVGLRPLYLPFALRLDAPRAGAQA